MTVSAVKNIRNEPSFMIGMAEDISKQLEAEQGTRQAADALRRYAERLEILHDIDRSILEARTSEDIAAATLEKIHQLLPSQRSSLVLFDFQTQDGGDHQLANRRGNPPHKRTNPRPRGVQSGNRAPAIRSK